MDNTLDMRKNIYVIIISIMKFLTEMIKNIIKVYNIIISIMKFLTKKQLINIIILYKFV